MGQSADVIIVGAGVTGLALALALRQRNISTLLLDSRKNVESVPRGLTLQPNGLAALEKLGALDKVRENGVETRILEIRDSHGNVLLEADYGLLNHPQNYILTTNAAELDLFLRYKAEQSGAQVIWEAELEELQRNNGQVQGVNFTTDNGSDQATASVVVGADGAHSMIRDSMGVKVETKKYPDSFITGLAGPVSELQGRARQYQDPGVMLGVMPASSETTFFFYSVGQRSFDQVKKEGIDEVKKELTSLAPETAQAFANVRAWTRLAYFTPTYTKVERWVDNGVALLGDSAHSFHPHAGQGLNLSLQDALVLAEVIEKAIKAGDVSMKSLLEYQTRQKMYADVIGMHADYSARYALSGNWLIKRLNKRALRKLSKNKELLKETLEIVAGVFEKKPGIIKLARIGGLLP